MAAIKSLAFLEGLHVASILTKLLDLDHLILRNYSVVWIRR